VIEKLGKKKDMAITIVMWLLTAVLSVVCLIAARTAMLSTLARFGLDAWVPAFNYLVVIFMAIFCIVVFIGGFEYHFRRAGEEESWHIFARTLAVEIGILLLTFFL
jgi:hypothetical protein